MMFLAMLTKKDRQRLVQDMREVFVTKDDIKSDLKTMEDRQNQKYAAKNDLKAMENRQDKKYATKDDLKPLKKAVSKIQRNTKVIINFFDREHLKLKERVKNIEDHLELASPTS